MSRQICLTFLETLQSLTHREAMLAVLPGLLELADQRMYSAKSAGHSVYYEPTVDCESSDRSSSTLDLALENANTFENPGEDDATLVLV